MWGDERLLEITSFSPEGDGLAALPSGRTVAIPHVYPGDFLIARERGRKTPPFIEGFWQQASSRTPARCQHFGHCGGCLWQGMSLEAQAQIKEEKIARLFPGAPFEPILKAERAWHYRARVEFTFSQDRLGFYAAHRRRVIDIESCQISPEWTKELLESVRGWWKRSGLPAYQPQRDVGSLRTLTARASLRTGARMVILTVNANEMPPPDAIDAWTLAVRNALGDDNLSLYLQKHVARAGSATQFELVHLFGETRLKEELHLPDRRLHFELSPTGFFQPHPLQAELLLKRLQEIAALKPGARLLDLYCGVGSIGLALVPMNGKLIGIERHPGAVEDAKRAGPHAEFHTGDAHEVCQSLKERLNDLDLLIVDPPRPGLGPDLLELILQLKPQKLLYVACNPVSQAREVEALCAQGFSLKLVQPVDLFPHTPHCENIVLLS